MALAERISGTEAKFVERMNNKAKEIGLKNTNFVNPTGLDENNHYSTAYDQAIIAMELLKHEQILEFSSLYEDYLRQDTPNKFWLVNTNKLERLYDGADGLKTGFTDDAKYCMAVTAKRDNMRILAIVLGEEVSKIRNQETVELLDYGFSQYKIDIIKKQGDIIDKIKIKKGNKDSINIILNQDITVLLNKNENSKDYKEKVILDDIKLPIQKNQKLGILEIYDNNNKIGSYDLVSSDKVNKKSIIKIYFDNLKDIITGNLEF